MKSRKAAMQGEKKTRRFATYLGWRGESSRMAAREGKSSNGVDRLVVWVKVDGIAAETNTQRRAVELRRRTH